MPKCLEGIVWKIGCGCANSIGELIYATIKCHPRILYAVAMCSQANMCPIKLHFHAVYSKLWYGYATTEDGLCHWKKMPYGDLKVRPFALTLENPSFKNNMQFNSHW